RTAASATAAAGARRRHGGGFAGGAHALPAWQTGKKGQNRQQVSAGDQDGIAHQGTHQYHYGPKNKGLPGQIGRRSTFATGRSRTHARGRGTKKRQNCRTPTPSWRKYPPHTHSAPLNV